MNSLPKQCELVNVKWRETGLYYTCGVGWGEMDYVATKSINYGGTSATLGERSAQVGIWFSDHGKMETNLCSWWHFVGGCSYNIWRVRVADVGLGREPGQYRLEASVPREIRIDWGERWLIHGNLILIPDVFVYVDFITCLGFSGMSVMQGLGFQVWIIPVTLGFSWLS